MNPLGSIQFWLTERERQIRMDSPFAWTARSHGQPVRMGTDAQGVSSHADNQRNEVPR